MRERYYLLYGEVKGGEMRRTKSREPDDGVKTARRAESSSWSGSLRRVYGRVS